MSAPVLVLPSASASVAASVAESSPRLPSAMAGARATVDSSAAQSVADSAVVSDVDSAAGSLRVWRPARPEQAATLLDGPRPGAASDAVWVVAAWAAGREVAVDGSASERRRSDYFALPRSAHPTREPMPRAAAAKR